MDQPASEDGLACSGLAAERQAWPVWMKDAALLRRAALVAAGLGLLVLYGRVIAGLVSAWRTNPDYSHGFLIAPLCAYFVWERRRRLAALEVRPSWAGLVIVAASLALLVAGQ